MRRREDDLSRAEGLGACPSAGLIRHNEHDRERLRSPRRATSVPGSERAHPASRREMMLTARHFALSAAVVMLLAGAGYARGAPASEGFALSFAIQINPKNPNIVYASSRLSDLDKRSVVKSTDGGQTWETADTGLTNPTSPTDSHGCTGGRARARPTITQRALRRHGARRLQDDRRSEDVEAREQGHRRRWWSRPPHVRKLHLRDRDRPCTHFDGLRGGPRHLEEHERRHYLEARTPKKLPLSIWASIRAGPRSCTRA